METVREKRSLTPWVVLLLALFFLVGACSLTVWATLQSTFSFLESFNPRIVKTASLNRGGKSIAYLTIDGVISGGREEIFDSLEEIEEGVEQEKLAGLLIFVNSPGGSVAPTQDIYRRILELRKKIPIVCSFGDVAASGGYYLATACEQIFALPGSTTASIGVILQLFNAEGLANWAKIKPLTIKAGKLKDVGSPFRAMTDEERAYLQTLISEVHEQFIRDVAKGREKKITEVALREIADGRIMTGEQALKVGLVDQSGGPRDALQWLRKEKNIAKDVEVIHLPRPRRTFESLFAQSKLATLLDEVRPITRPFHGLIPMLLPTYYQAD